RLRAPIELDSWTENILLDRLGFQQIAELEVAPRVRVHRDGQRNQIQGEEIAFAHERSFLFEADEMNGSGLCGAQLGAQNHRSRTHRPSRGKSSHVSSPSK